MESINVSVIVVTYNSDLDKLKRTLKSVICQKKVSFEIIVSDDGSQTGLSEDVERFFQENDFVDYKVIRNPRNLGTIKNLYGALQVAKGEYVYSTSPGDFIYDEYTMYEFYHFAKTKKAEICFGNYIKYNYENGELHLYSDHYAPRSPERYTKGLKNSKVAFFLIEDNICGIAYFRKRALFTQLIEYVSQYAIYAEDGTTSALALMQNTDIIYFNKNIAWYEYGTGISTAGNKEWTKKIKEDYDNTYAYLYETYPKSAVLSVKKHQYIRMDFLKRHPVTALRKSRLNKCPDRKVTYTNDDMEKIKKLLEM